MPYSNFPLPRPTEQASQRASAEQKCIHTLETECFPPCSVSLSEVSNWYFLWWISLLLLSSQPQSSAYLGFLSCLQYWELFAESALSDTSPHRLGLVKFSLSSDMTGQTAGCTRCFSSWTEVQLLRCKQKLRAYQAGSLTRHPVSCPHNLLTATLQTTPCLHFSAPHSKQQSTRTKQAASHSNVGSFTEQS